MAKSITESDSNYDHLEKMAVKDLLVNINREDETVATAVNKCIPQIEALVSQIVPKMRDGGRLFYIGAGTSGRLGIVDASECPPTFGVSHEKVIGLIAGGDRAIRKAVEFAEDDENQGWKDLSNYKITTQDTVIGIAASGSTPYVIGTVRDARMKGCLTGCITCNPNTELSKQAEYPIEILVGPEFVTGSTRMKAGTAQKMALNMISTATMIQLGHVVGNKMVDMQLSNHKLEKRAIQMLMDKLNIDAEVAKSLLKEHGSVRDAINSYKP